MNATGRIGSDHQPLLDREHPFGYGWGVAAGPCHHHGRTVPGGFIHRPARIHRKDVTTTPYGAPDR